MPEGHKETLQLIFIPQLLSWCIQYQQIYSINIYFPNYIISQNIYFPTLCPKGTRKPPNLYSSPKCWHDIFNTNIYIQLIHIPKMYISPPLCPKGTQKPINLNSSPKCWHDISNTKVFIQLTYISQIVGTIYEYSYITLTYIYFQKNCSIIQYIYIYCLQVFHTKCISKI